MKRGDKNILNILYNKDAKRERERAFLRESKYTH